MHPTDREDLRTALASALGMYDREITDDGLDTWMASLKAFDLETVRVAIRAHMEADDEGKRAPRPVDIWRRLTSGGGKGTQCSAVSVANGRCDYPGVFSDATDGRGQWWCPWHRQHRTGPEADRYIEASKSIDFGTAASKRIERMNAEARESPTVARVRAQMAEKAIRRAPREPGQDDEDIAA